MMNVNTASADKRPGTVVSGKRPGDEMNEHDALWSLEEIDAPEVWSLASFDDLLPYEMS